MSKKDKTAKLNSKIKELEEKVKNLENNWKRALADYQNLVKRTEEEKRHWSKFASKNIINKLLPILDTLEKANEHINDEGLSLALKQFIETLSKEGVSEIESLGKTFDPKVHECVDVEEGEEEGKISHVFTKGYKLNEEVIRPAKVKVIKKKVDQEAEKLAQKAAQTGNYM